MRAVGILLRCKETYMTKIRGGEEESLLGCWSEEEEGEESVMAKMWTWLGDMKDEFCWELGRYMGFGEEE